MIEAIAYDFYGCQVKQTKPPILEVGILDTCEGFIEIQIPGIKSDCTIDAYVYKVNAPTYTEPRYIRTGSDLYESSVLFYEKEILPSGNLQIFYRFDAYSIAEVSNNDYFAITFHINRLQSSSEVKVLTDVIIHIKNQFKDA